VKFVSSVRHVAVPITMSSESRFITLEDITPQNLGLMKTLNGVVFPVPYSDKFYKECLTVGELAKFGESSFIPSFSVFLLVSFYFIKVRD
jgi:hypothetical protein